MNRIPLHSLVLLVGPVASGKSKFAHDLFGHKDIINYGQIHEELTGDYKNQHANEIVFTEYYRRIDLKLSMGQRVVADANHIKKKERMSIAQLGAKYHVPVYYIIINEINEVVGLKTGIELTETVRPYFKRFERISIDFAVMEKSDVIVCIPVDFGWNDIGSFNALEEVFEKDSDLNIVKDAYYVQLDSSNNIVISDDKTRIITSIGVSNMIIVQTKDALLVYNKDEAQKIKALLKKIG